MAENIYPKFTDMIPTVEDIQLIVDSLREQDRNQITRDGIFTPGIVNEQSDYLSAGTNTNSLRIKPFVAYTAKGNRIEVNSEWDNLYPIESTITISDDNIVNKNINIPVWSATNTIEYSTLNEPSITQSIQVLKLGRGSILHGIKLKINTLFSVENTNPDIFVSIGTQAEEDKFLPKTLVSNNTTNTDISIMNLMYSMDDETDVYITFTSETVNLNTLTNGSLNLNFCVADLTDSSSSSTVSLAELQNIEVKTWQASTLYHIVARYDETLSDYRSLKYTTIDGTTITTNSEPTRVTTNYKLFALRKTGSVIDNSTLDDVKLGEVITDASGNIVSININGKNTQGVDYTQYLTLPGYRYINNINAEQIGDGSVSNTQFSYLNTLTSNVQSQLSSKASLRGDNNFTGQNTFTNQIIGSIDKVNGFSAEATPTANSLLVLDNNGKVPASAISESTFGSIGNIYTISSGKTTDGRADFLSPSTDNTSIIISASETEPLVINYADGTSETFTEDQSINEIVTDGNYYIVKEKQGNFVALPISGGTKAVIPDLSSDNFTYEGNSGKVFKSYNNDGTAYKAFDGTVTTGTQLGWLQYINHPLLGTQTSYSASPTEIVVNFPEKVIPKAMAACFRMQENEATPRVWYFEGTNDTYTGSESVTWNQLFIEPRNNESWNIGQIKTIKTNSMEPTGYKTFRISFLLNDVSINNPMAGETTTGITLPINCYYFQIYTNVDNTNSNNIVEGYVKPSNMNVGSYFLDISKKPYKGYKSIGNNEFSEIQFAKLGFVEIETNFTSITCYSFGYNNFTISDPIEVEKHTQIQFYHNLGIIPNIVNIKFVCLSANNGYAVGDTIDNIYASDSEGLTTIKDSLETTFNYISVLPGTNSSNLYVKHKTTGSLEEISDSQWAAIIYCARGW